MKNPNGYGGIRKLSGNRRRPYAVYVTTGWELVNGKAKQNQACLGYFATRKEAMLCLAEYNKDPYDIDARKTTFADLYQILYDRKIQHLATSARRVYTTSYDKCKRLHNQPIYRIKTADLQAVLDANAGASRSTLNNIVVLFHAIFKLALEFELVNRDYADFVTISPKKEKAKKEPFTITEINAIYEHISDAPVCADILILIYTGLRVSEYLALTPDDVHLSERCLEVRGTKTAAANRLVPIHLDIMPLIENKLLTATNYLTKQAGGAAANRAAYFRKDFEDACNKLNMEHTPHECRHSFATYAAASGLNPILVKKILGHSTQDLTEKVYTHTFIDSLVAEIDKLVILP